LGRSVSRYLARRDGEGVLTGGVVYDALVEAGMKGWMGYGLGD
jgi:hypothetical protein